jgi:hypothetical protein
MITISISKQNSNPSLVLIIEPKNGLNVNLRTGTGLYCMHLCCTGLQILVVLLVNALSILLIKDEIFIISQV